MESYLSKNITFYVIPNEFDNISVFNLGEYNDAQYTLTNQKFGTQYQKGEPLEVFVNGKDGILYFNTEVVDYNNNSLTIHAPTEYEILQRRENERVILNKDITLYDKNNEKIDAKLIDLSVGGMKIEVQSQLLINEKYNTKLNFDTIDLNFIFTPLRIEFENENYLISGQLLSDNPGDKIELVQYCYKKLFEKSNR